MTDTDRRADLEHPPVRTMRLLIFGSTGGVGRQLVEQALDAGHAVSAFARDPAAVKVEHKCLEVIRGDAMDAASVSRAMAGHDAVLAALGSPPWRNTAVRSEGSRHIVDAMEGAGVRRLVSLSTLGVGDSWPMLPFKFRLLFRTLLRNALAAHELQERYIAASHLDWTIVRPGAYTDGPRTGAYRHGFAPTDPAIAAEVSRSDVADFMLLQLTDETYLRRTTGLSYAR